MKKVVIWIALSLWSVMTVFAGETAYLFSYFINDSKDGLHLAYSYDGLNWLPLHGGRSYLTPAFASRRTALFTWSGLPVGRTGLSDMPLHAIWFIGVSNKQSL